MSITVIRHFISTENRQFTSLIYLDINDSSQCKCTYFHIGNVATSSIYNMSYLIDMHSIQILLQIKRFGATKLRLYYLDALHKKILDIYKPNCLVNEIMMRHSKCTPLSFLIGTSYAFNSFICDILTESEDTYINILVLVI